jgi:hypothetical protein
VLYPLVLADNHDAGNILWSHKNRSQFIKDMNTRAESLNMKDTVFKDVLGEEETTVTTLDDIVKLMMFIKEYKPFLIKVLGMSEYKTPLFKTTSLYESKEYSIGGLQDSENSLRLSLITYEVPHKKDITQKTKKTLLVLVQGVDDAVQTTDTLYTWITTSLMLRN